MDRSEFRDFAAKVAAELGMDLDTGSEYTWCETILSVTGDGTGYVLGLPRVQDRRSEIHPVWPRTRASHPALRIGVTISRGPHAVAADIARRLARPYREALRAIAAYDREEAAEQAARAALAARIAALFPEGKVSAPSHCQNDYRTELIIHGENLRGGSVKFHGDGGEAEFDRFRVPAEVAVAMLAAWAQAPPPAPAPVPPPVPDPGPVAVPEMQAVAPAPPLPARVRAPRPAPADPSGLLARAARLLGEAGISTDGGGHAAPRPDPVA
jgi:hypothetical protein